MIDDTLLNACGPLKTTSKKESRTTYSTLLYPPAASRQQQQQQQHLMDGASTGGGDALMEGSQIKNYTLGRLLGAGAQAEAFERHWSECEALVKEVLVTANEKTFLETRLFLDRRAGRVVEALPAAVLLGSVDGLDNEKSFAEFAEFMRSSRDSNDLVSSSSSSSSSVLPTRPTQSLVAALRSEMCWNVKSAVEHLVECIIMNECIPPPPLNKKKRRKADDDDDDDDEDDDAPVASSRRLHTTPLQRLQRWWKSPRGGDAIRNGNKSIVIMFDCEAVTPEISRELVHFASHLRRDAELKMPVALTLGLTSSTVNGIHGIMTFEETRLLEIRQFRTKESLEVFNSVFEKLVVEGNTRLPLRMSRATMTWLSDRFIRDDFSLSGFIRGLKFAAMTHFASHPLSFLCCAPPPTLLAKPLDHDDDDDENDREIDSKIKQWIEDVENRVKNSGLASSLEETMRGAARAPPGKVQQQLTPSTTRSLETSLMRLELHRQAFSRVFSCYLLASRSLGLAPSATVREIYLDLDLDDSMRRLEKRIKSSANVSLTKLNAVMRGILKILSGSGRSEDETSSRWERHRQHGGCLRMEIDSIEALLEHEGWAIPFADSVEALEIKRMARGVRTRATARGVANGNGAADGEGGDDGIKFPKDDEGGDEEEDDEIMNGIERRGAHLRRVPPQSAFVAANPKAKNGLINNNNNNHHPSLITTTTTTTTRMGGMARRKPIAEALMESVPASVNYGPAKRRKLQMQNFILDAEARERLTMRKRQEMMKQTTMEEKQNELEHEDEEQDEVEREKSRILARKALESEIRAKCHEILRKLFTKHLVSPTRLGPLGVLFECEAKKRLEECFNANPAASLKSSLERAVEKLAPFPTGEASGEKDEDDDEEEEEEDEEEDDLPDAAVAFAVLREEASLSSRLYASVDVVAWYEAFQRSAGGAGAGEDERRLALARFRRACAELEHIGAIKFKQGAKSVQITLV